MKKIFLITIFAISSLFAQFKSIDAKELLSMQKQGIVVVDIRTPQEWKTTGIIKGAKTIEFYSANGGVDFIAFMKELTKYVSTSKQPFIIYCAHANRTRTVGNFFSKAGLVANIYDLKGGIEYGWRDLGYKTVPYEEK